MTPRKLLPALLLALVVLPATAQAQGRTLEALVQLHETQYGLHIAPERIDANVGDTIRMEVANLGQARHNLVVCATPGEETCASDRLAFTPNLASNATHVLTVTPPEPGTYAYYCDLPGHREGGMKGELVVQGEAKNETPLPALPLAALAALAAVLVLRRRESA